MRLRFVPPNFGMKATRYRSRPADSDAAYKVGQDRRSFVSSYCSTSEPSWHVYGMHLLHAEPPCLSIVRSLRTALADNSLAESLDALPPKRE